MKALTSLAGMLATALVLGFGQPARAEDQAGREFRCQDYAREGIKEQALNLEDGCGYRGELWSDDLGGHYFWCMSAPQSAANARYWRREELLRQCGM